MNKSNNGLGCFIGAFIFVVVLPYLLIFVFGFFSGIKDAIVNRDNNSPKYLNILSSTDNQDLDVHIREFANKNGIKININYMGDIEIVEELNHNSANYDAVWIGNSLWLYMLDNSYLTSNSKSISISPIVMGVKKSKAEELGLVGKAVTNKDILNLVREGNLKYVMSSVTATNDGATAYLGFLNTLAGSPEVLKEEMLDNPDLLNDVRDLFKGVERVSGDQFFLESMFINSSNYEAVIASESSLISINKKLIDIGKESLYLLYPIDGVPINDSTFAFIDNGKDREESFLKIQRYLLGDEGQDSLKALGRRTWYGGVTTDVDQKVFNKDWGIDTTKYLVATKYPSKAVITKAINLYIEELRKPSHTVFCLDYSGSMYGSGEEALIEAVDYILTYEKASKDKLQFSKYDSITVIPFSSYNIGEFKTKNGKETKELLNLVHSIRPNGGTNLYDCLNKGISVLNNEDKGLTKTIIAMTDGKINYSSYNDFNSNYSKNGNNIPIYSIMFGDADRDELTKIAVVSNAKVFDGRTNLLRAFKEVRGYS